MTTTAAMIEYLPRSDEETLDIKKCVRWQTQSFFILVQMQQQ
jgi:hypothetical protein